jgi:hypothetical protein
VIASSRVAEAAVAPPSARSVANACDCHSSPRAGAAGTQAAVPSAYDAGPALGCGGAAFPPQLRRPLSAGAACCGSGRPTGRQGAGTSRIVPAEHTRLCGFAPGSEASLGKIFEHSPLQMGQSLRLLGLHSYLLLAPEIVPQILHWVIGSTSVFSMRMICAVVRLVRFLVESPAQPAWTRNPIHPGPIHMVRVIVRVARETVNDRYISINH